MRTRILERLTGKSQKQILCACILACPKYHTLLSSETSYLHTKKLVQGLAWRRHSANITHSLCWVHHSDANQHFVSKANAGKRKKQGDPEGTPSHTGHSLLNRWEPPAEPGQAPPLRKDLHLNGFMPLSRILSLSIDDFTLWKVPQEMKELVTLSDNDFIRWFRKSPLIEHHFYFPSWKGLRSAACSAASARGRWHGTGRNWENTKGRSVAHSDHASLVTFKFLKI